MLIQSNKIDFNGQHIYAGIDAHLKSWNVTVMTEELIIKTFSQNPQGQSTGSGHQPAVPGFEPGCFPPKAWPGSLCTTVKYQNICLETN